MQRLAPRYDGRVSCQIAGNSLPPRQNCHLPYMYSSRKGVSETALHLMKAARPNAFATDSLQRERLHQAAPSLLNKQLQQTLLSGIAFHHAAMELQDRATVEQLFRERLILVLTLTLDQQKGTMHELHEQPNEAVTNMISCWPRVDGGLTD